MRILVTGRSSSGSWRIRGEQLGAAIGAHVELNANNPKGFDLAIVVKRPRIDVLARLAQRGVPWVWDIVDAYPQPDGNEWGREQCMSWLRAEVANTKPRAIVAATEAMAADCAEFKLPVLTLPHHARPGLARNPIRAVVKTVGYEGGENYLGIWRERLERECAARGWRFVVNPASLADLDIVVAVRAQTGYAPRHWKSNVKAANAQGSGTPCILNRERGYLERTNGTAYFWADSEVEMKQRLDALTPHDVRAAYSRELLSATPRLDVIAQSYLSWLLTLSF